jgi:hypothetical protein
VPKIIVCGRRYLGGVNRAGEVWWTRARDNAQRFDDTAAVVAFHRRHCMLTDITIEEDLGCPAHAAES